MTLNNHPHDFALLEDLRNLPKAHPQCRECSEPPLIYLLHQSVPVVFALPLRPFAAVFLPLDELSSQWQPALVSLVQPFLFLSALVLVPHALLTPVALSVLRLALARLDLLKIFAFVPIAPGLHALAAAFHSAVHALPLPISAFLLLALFAFAEKNCATSLDAFLSPLQFASFLPLPSATLLVLVSQSPLVSGAFALLLKLQFVLFLQPLMLLFLSIVGVFSPSP